MSLAHRRPLWQFCPAYCIQLFLHFVGVLVLLDLHTHSIKSDDGRAKVENYCQWIRSKNLPLDGFVLTEHRQFDNESDYSGLAEKFGLPVFLCLWSRSLRPVTLTGR